jgi:hypothetical protein
VTIPWDERLPLSPPVAGDAAAPAAARAPWVGAVPPTPPPASRAPARRARGGGIAWMVMAGVVVALALVTAAYLVTSAT